MVDGSKHLAMFSDIVPKEFSENANGLDLGVIADEVEMCTVYYMPGYREAAERLFALNIGTRQEGFIPDVEREIGTLLGYEEWQIDAFLRHVTRSR